MSLSGFLFSVSFSLVGALSCRHSMSEEFAGRPACLLLLAPAKREGEGGSRRERQLAREEAGESSRERSRAREGKDLTKGVRAIKFVISKQGPVIGRKRARLPGLWRGGEKERQERSRERKRGKREQVEI